MKRGYRLLESGEIIRPRDRALKGGFIKLVSSSKVGTTFNMNHESAVYRWCKYEDFEATEIKYSQHEDFKYHSHWIMHLGTHYPENGYDVEAQDTIFGGHIINAYCSKCEVRYDFLNRKIRLFKNFKELPAGDDVSGVRVLLIIGKKIRSH